VLHSTISTNSTILDWEPALQHIQPLLVKFMDTARKVLDCDKVTLFLHDSSTKELWTCVIKDDAVREIRIPSNEGLAGAAFQTGETISIDDAQNDPRHRRDIADKSGYVCNSMLIEPLVNRKGERIGVIQAINKRGNAAFTKADEARMRQFATEVVNTLEDASKWKSLIPGLMMVVGVAAVASGLHWLLPPAAGKVVGVVLVAIILGLFIRNVFRLPVNWEPGIRFAVHNMLRAAIVLLGARIAFGDVMHIGAKAALLIVALVAMAFAVGHVLGHLLKIPVRLATLLAAGASICGNSAIAALSPVIKANEEEMSYAIAVTTVMGTTAVILYPLIGAYFGFGDAFYGTWVGTSVHDTAQAVAAGFALGSEAGDVATVVKLTRNAFLGVIIVLVGLAYARWVGGLIGGKKVPLSKRLQQSFPAFLLGFLFLALLNSFGSFAWMSGHLGLDVSNMLSSLSAWLMLGALAGVGLSTNLGQIRKSGFKPVIVGVAVTASVALFSLLLISLFGAAGG
jgi:uncharacterized integral membrane protein (TIGR00698 family)